MCIRDRPTTGPEPEASPLLEAPPEAGGVASPPRPQRLFATPNPAQRPEQMQSTPEDHLPPFGE
eukprot:1497385-Alexandrium_andersonii.AAC.1